MTRGCTLSDTSVGLHYTLLLHHPTFEKVSCACMYVCLDSNIDVCIYR